VEEMGRERERGNVKGKAGMKRGRKRKKRNGRQTRAESGKKGIHTHTDF